MTYDQAIVEFTRTYGEPITVSHEKSGNRYLLEFDVLKCAADAGQTDPYVYGWSENAHPFSRRKYYWFHLSTVGVPK